MAAMDNVDEAEFLARFADPATKADFARRAFDALSERARPWLERKLRASGWNSDDSQDIVQKTLLSAWGKRGHFQARSVAEWRGYLSKIATRHALDLVRERKDMPSEIPEAGRPDPLIDWFESEEGWAQANVLFLGLDPSLSTRTHDRQLLAATYFYVDGYPWNTVLRLLPPDPDSPRPLTRPRLDAWLEDPGVLRYLAFSTLYRTSAELTSYLLKKSAWSAAECDAIRWRFQHALLLNQIIERHDCTLTHSELEQLYARCAELFPFKQQMARLLANLSSAEALGSRHLWQRLAFEYAYAEELPHRDIRARTQPAAEQVGFDVTTTRLTMWLSDRRLIRRLAKHLLDLRQNRAENRDDFE